MSEFDLDKYFAERSSLPPIDKKIDVVARASAEKRAILENQGAIIAGKMAGTSAGWGGELGVDPESNMGRLTNIAANAYSGTSRAVGDMAVIAPAATAFANESGMTEDKFLAYNNFVQGKATPADIALLNAPSGVQAPGMPRVATNMELFQQAKTARASARNIDQSFDRTDVVNTRAKDKFTADLGKGFTPAWDEVKEGVKQLKNNPLELDGFGNVIAGAARLLYNTGEAAADNKQGSLEYVAENVPQLLIGGIRKVGAKLLLGSNVGYASDYYQKGIEKYQSENGGAYPPEAMRKEMAKHTFGAGIAEHVGDKVTMGLGKLAGKAATDAAKVSILQAAKNTGKAAGIGFVNESATEAYQTYAEGEASLTPASAEDIYVGGAIGGITGGVISGTGRAIAEKLETTPEKIQARQETAEEVLKFKEAVLANDTSTYTDPTKSKQYDLSKAIGVLLSNAQLPDTAPEAKTKNLEQANVLMEQLEEQHTKATEWVQSHTPEGIERMQAEIANAEAQIVAIDPANVEQLAQANGVVEFLKEDLASLTDKKSLMKAKTKLSKLDRQLRDGHSRLAGLVTESNTQLNEAEVDTLIDEVNGIPPEPTVSINEAGEEVVEPPVEQEFTPVQRLINLSMTQPDAISSDMANKLANDMSNGLDTIQRDHLRVMSAARVAENKLSTLGKVSQEVLYGSSKNAGISEYKAQITAAIAAGSKGTALKRLALLEAFAIDHASKAKAAREAIKGGISGNRIVKLKGGAGWVMVPKKQKLDQATMDSNGALTVVSGRLVEGIQAEAEALSKATLEMKSATNIKFGIAPKQEQVVQSDPASESQNTTDLQLLSIREKREREGRVEEDKSSSPSKPQKVTPETLVSLDELMDSTVQNGSTSVKPLTQENAIPVTAASPASEPSSPTLADARGATVPASAPAAKPKKKVAELPALPPLAPNATEQEKADWILREAQAKAEQQAQVAKPEATEQQAVVSEANPAQVAEVVTAEAAVEVLKQKGPENSPYNKRKLGDFFNVIGLDQNPLVSVKDFLSKINSGELSFIDFLPQFDTVNEQQSKALNVYRKLATKWMPAITANLKKKDNEDFYYTDLMQHFILPSGDIEQNVKSAISFAAISYTAETAGRSQFNSNDEINELLGFDNSEGNRVTVDERSLMGSVIGLQSQAHSSLGKRAMKALGMEVKQGAPMDTVSRMENAIGAHALRLLIDGPDAMFVRVHIKEADLAPLRKKEKTTEAAPVLSAEEAKKLAEKQKNMQEWVFISVKRDEADNPMPNAQTILEAFRGSNGVVSKLFGVEDTLIPPSFSPIGKIKAYTRRTKQKVGSYLTTAIKGANRQKNYLRQDKLKVRNVIGTDAFLRIMGYEETNNETMHIDDRDNNTARNDGLRRELDRMDEFVPLLEDQENGLDQAFYFDHYAMKQGRVAINTNMVNPQSSKLHRGMVYQPSWKTTVDTTNVDQMNNFWLRAAEGMGIKTEQKDRSDALDKIQELYESELIQEALAALNRISEETDPTLSEQEITAIEKAAAKGKEKAHSLDALMGMAEYAKMQESQIQNPDNKSFDTIMMGEVDGVTNGPMLSHLLMGAARDVPALFDILNRGGFFQIGTGNLQFNVWRSTDGNQDIYEKTATNMFKALADLIRDQEVSAVDVAKVEYFLGKLRDAEGNIQSAGRKLVKTPITAVNYGQSMKNAIEETMAGDFISSIRDAIATMAMMEKADPEGTVADVRKLVGKLNDIGFEFKAGTTAKQMLNRSISDEVRQKLTELFADTFGKAVSVTIKKDFGNLLAKRRTFNTTADMTYSVADAVYREIRTAFIQELVQRELDAPGTGIATNNGKTPEAIHDITSAQQKELDQRILAVMPALQTAMSLKEKTDSSTGIRIGKTKLEMDNTLAYENRVQFGQPYESNDPYAKPIYSVKTHGNRVVGDKPSVAMGANSTLSTDAAISMTAFMDAVKAKIGVLNLHDAHGTGIQHLVQVGKQLNKAVWETMMVYSPAEQMYQSLVRTLKGTLDVLNNPDTPATVVEALAHEMMAQSKASPVWVKEEGQKARKTAPISPLSILMTRAIEAKRLAYEADTIKFGAMAQMGSIAQYAIEGGNFEVDAKLRAQAQAKLDALSPLMSKEEIDIIQGVADKLTTAITALMPVVTAPISTPKKTVTPTKEVSELGTPLIPSTPALVRAFEDNPTMTVAEVVTLLKSKITSEYGQKLLGQIERVVGSDLTVRYLKKGTSLDSLLAPGGNKARGWYVNTTTGQQEIYVLSPDFVHSGLTAELLMHELLHAALSRTIDNAQQEGKGNAFALVQELEQLRELLIKEAKGTFPEALVDVHEMVSWGMTNKDFQDLLRKVSMKSETTGNKLMDGMKLFARAVVKMLFGRTNDGMQDGVTMLVNNVAGLFNAATQAKAKKVGKKIVLNQTNAGNPSANLRDLTTLDIYDALEQNNNGTVVSSEFSIKLKSLLNGMVSTLYGPAGAFKAALMEQTASKPEDVFQEALATDQAPMAFGGLAAGFAFTNQEAFVADQVHATVFEATSNNSGQISLAYKELAKLYEEVRNKVTEATFTNGTSAVEIAQGKALYKYLFDVKLDANGTSDYLARFAAMGLAHEGFNKILQMATETKDRDTTGMGFVDRLSQLFENILDWFAEKMTGTMEGQNADLKLVALVTKIVRIEENRRSLLKARTDYLGPVERQFGEMSEAARSKIEAFGKLPFFKDSQNGVVRLAGAMTSAVAGDRMQFILEGYNKLRDHVTTGQQNVAAALVTEALGANEGNMAFHFLLRATKHLEGLRKQMITNTGKVVLGSFANLGKDLTDIQKRAISAVFLRTDMSALLGTYTMDQLKDLINDPRILRKEVAKYEKQFASLGQASRFSRYFINGAKALAYYKATGKVTTEHVMMNAGNISKLYGTGQQARITAAEATQAEAIIDPLASLYSLLYMTTTENQLIAKAAREVINIEAARTDGGNGVEHILLTHKMLQEKSREELFAGSEALQMKGYTPETYDPYMKVVVANKTEGALLMMAGYRQGDAVGIDKADPAYGKGAQHLYHLRDGGLKPWLSGIFSTTSMKSKGSKAHDGNLSQSYVGQLNQDMMVDFQAKKDAGLRAMFSNVDFDPSKVTDTHTAPVFNANGDVVNYRYMMLESTKDDLLFRDNRPDRVLGNMAGSIVDKVSSVKQNKKAVATLKEQYNQEFGERPSAYMEVGPKSIDPQLREIWRLLPQATKDDVKEIWGRDGMKVRVDLLDINFGYRKLSIADAFDKEYTERNFLQKMFVQIVTSHFEDKAALRTRQFEDVWQAVVKLTKANLVVRSWSTMSGNLRSNWSQLLLMGVSPAQIFKHHRIAFKSALAYKRDNEEIFALRHQVESGYMEPGQTKDKLEHRITVLQDAINRNPIKPLIDAGLMPTIAEDIDVDEDIYSYKSRLVKQTEVVTNKINPTVVSVGRELLMLEGSKTYAAMSYATQISDFLARYTLYQVKIEQGMKQDDAVQLASDAFINYDVPTHRMVQYANDAGLVMFTKYYIRIQKMILRIYKESPGKAMALLVAEGFLGAQPTVLDSSMWTRFGNPVNMGAFDYPGSLDAISTVRVLTYPFRSGNPAE